MGRLAIIIMVTMCSSCVEKIPVEVNIGSQVDNRPPFSGGPPGGEGSGPWREIAVTVKRGDLKRFAEADMTFFAEFNNCRGGDNIWVDSLYLNDQVLTLNNFRPAGPGGANSYLY